MMLLYLRPKFRKLRFQMIADRQRDAKVIGVGIYELAHYPNLRIRLSTVQRVVADHLRLPTVVAIRVDSCAVVDVEHFGLHPGRPHELDLLGFLVVQGDLPLQRVEVMVWKGFRNLAPQVGLEPTTLRLTAT